MKIELLDRAAELEAALIGSVINGGDITTVIGMINPDHFVSDHNRVVWEAMLDFVNRKVVPTKPALLDRLRGHRIFKNETDLELAVSGDQDAGVPQMIKRIAASLSSAHARYALAVTCEGIMNEISASEHEVPTDKLLMDIRDAVDRMKVETGFRTTGAMEVTWDLLDDIANPPPITRTGFPAYDKVLGGGFMAGETYTLAGANKSGKTMMAGSISANLNGNGVRHAYWCMEMGQKQITQRMVAAHENFPAFNFLNENTRMSTKMGDAIIRYQQWAIDHDNIVFTDCPLLRASDAKAMLYRAKMDGCEGVIIDYFSLISPDIGFRGNQNEHQDIMAQDLTKTAKDLGLWLLVIAQTNSSGSTYGSAALLRASTHIAVLERVDDEEASKSGYRWLRTISARLTMSEDVGSSDAAGLKIHHHGSHIEEVYG
jgi:replicative DNA helicase